MEQSIIDSTKQQCCLADLVLHHTWSVRCLGDFVVPLRRRLPDLRQRRQRQPTSSAATGDPLSSILLARMEEDMSLFLRNHRALMRMSHPPQQQPQDDNNDGDDAGTYVKISWCQLWGKEHEDEEDHTASGAVLGQRQDKRRATKKRSRPSNKGKKRTKLDASLHTNDKDSVTDDHNSQPKSNTTLSKQRQRQQHLLIDIRIDEEQSAQIVCCFPKFRNDDNVDDIDGGCHHHRRENNGAAKTKHHHQPLSAATNNNNIWGFDFLLTRGSKRSFEAIFAWFETFTGCTVAKSPFCPSASAVAQAMTLWTSQQYQQQQHFQSTCQQQQQQNTGTSSTTSDGGDGDDSHSIMERNSVDNTGNIKPLVLTYAVPLGMESCGLETLSLTVPPTALVRVCQDMLSFRRQQQTNVPKKKNDGEATATTTTTTIETRQEDSPPPPEFLPVVSFFQCFLRETFRINVESFSLVRGSCAAAVLGCDGRCKPCCANLLESVLQEIRYMTKSTCHNSKS